MSLDITLYEDITDKLQAWNERKTKSLDEAGEMKGLLPLIEEYYENYKPNIKDNILYSANITHNLNIMAEKAGIYKYLWRPEEINIKYAKELIKPLSNGLERLRKSPKYYSRFNASNGWGLYEHFVLFVENYLNACVKYPDAIISVDR